MTKDKVSNKDMKDDKIALVTGSSTLEIISHNISHLNIKVSSWIC